MYRGVLISGCWNRGVPLYTEVSSFQGVGIEEFHCKQRCPQVSLFQGVGIEVLLYVNTTTFKYLSAWLPIK